jgi:homoserine dehydrogenase
MKEIHVALLGLGNVGRAFAEYCRTTGDSVSPRLNIRAVADSSGGLILDSYEDFDRILDQKSQRRKLSESAPAPLLRDATAFLRSLKPAGISVLVESLPTNIQSGQPALDLLTKALFLGLNVVTVDKGPLIHGFEALHSASKAGGSSFAYTGTTGVRIPPELSDEPVLEIAGVLNGTTNHILTDMLERGSRFDTALAQAQTDGIAEPDPSLDVEGWDTAAKILILAKSLMNPATSLAEVSRVGINQESEAFIERARASGQVVRLVGRARQSSSRLRVSVAPELVASGSPFFSVTGTSKIAVFKTERGEVVSKSRSGRDAISQTIVDDVWKVARKAT